MPHDLQPPLKKQLLPVLIVRVGGAVIRINILSGGQRKRIYARRAIAKFGENAASDSGKGRSLPDIEIRCDTTRRADRLCLWRHDHYLFIYSHYIQRHEQHRIVSSHTATEEIGD